jgi:hypothetical protein
MKLLICISITFFSALSFAKPLPTLPVKGKVVSFDDKEIEMNSQDELVKVPRAAVKKRSLKVGEEVIADLTLEQFANLKPLKSSESQ